MLSGSKDEIVREVGPNPTEGRNWNPKEEVQEAEAALRHAEIVGKFQFGRGGLGLGSGKPVGTKQVPKRRENWSWSRYKDRRR